MKPLGQELSQLVARRPVQEFKQKFLDCAAGSSAEMSAAMEFITVLSMCCPMENTLGSLDTLEDPSRASLILGLENNSTKKVFNSFRVLYVMQTP